MKKDGLGKIQETGWNKIFYKLPSSEMTEELLNASGVSDDEYKNAFDKESDKHNQEQSEEYMAINPYNKNADKN